METLILKNHLYKIADKITKNNLVYSHDNVKQEASRWLK